jgi:hypothetical protein
MCGISGEFLVVTCTVSCATRLPIAHLVANSLSLTNKFFLPVVAADLDA